VPSNPRRFFCLVATASRCDRAIQHRHHTVSARSSLCRIVVAVTLPQFRVFFGIPGWASA
jgi:hypothetical protein